MHDMLLAVTIAVSGVKSLEIDHVPNDISYRVALTPDDVVERARQRVQTRDPQTIANVVAAIRNTGAHVDAQAADLRYAIRLRNARGATVAVIYLNADGLRGVVDGAPVRFAGDAIKRAVLAGFPALEK